MEHRRDMATRIPMNTQGCVQCTAYARSDKNVADETKFKISGYTVHVHVYTASHKTFLEQSVICPTSYSEIQSIQIISENWQY